MQAIKQQAERAQKAAQEARTSATSAQTQLQRAVGDIEALRKAFLSVRDRVKDLEGQNKVRECQPDTGLCQARSGC